MEEAGIEPALPNCASSGSSTAVLESAPNPTSEGSAPVARTYGYRRNMLRTLPLHPRVHLETATTLSDEPLYSESLTPHEPA